MTNNQIISELAKLQGWTHINVSDLTGYVPDQGMPGLCRLPSYLSDHNLLYDIESRYDDPSKLVKRIKWINTLRDVVGRKKPKNKSGQSLVSDYDMLRATCEERCEAILRTEGIWND